MMSYLDFLCRSRKKNFCLMNSWVQRTKFRRRFLVKIEEEPSYLQKSNWFPKLWLISKIVRNQVNEFRKLGPRWSDGNFDEDVVVVVVADGVVVVVADGVVVDDDDAQGWKNYVTGTNQSNEQAARRMRSNLPPIKLVECISFAFSKYYLTWLRGLSECLLRQLKGYWLIEDLCFEKGMLYGWQEHCSR